MTQSDTRPHTLRVPAPLDLGMLWVAFLRALPFALFLGLVAGAVTTVAMDRREPVYEVTSTVSLGVLSDSDIPQWIIERAEPVYLSIAQDRETVEHVSTVTGIPDPRISATAGSVQGIIQITAEGADVAQARSIVDETVTALIRRSARMHETAMFAASSQSEELTAPLRRQIVERRAADPGAPIDDLEWQIELISREIATLVPEIVPPVQVSQTDNGGEPVRPQPLQTGLVAGMATALLVVLPLTWWNFRRPRRVGRMWLRGLHNRYGVDTESAPFDDGLSPLAEARAAEVLAAGNTVLLLGRTGSLEHLTDGESGHVHEAAWLDPWWREHPPNDVGLAVVTVSRRTRQLREVEQAVDHLTATGIPTMVALNRVTRSSGIAENSEEEA